MPAEAQGEALGLVSTVLGALNNCLARSYIAQISSHPLKMLRIESLFAGSEGSHPQG
jgi:hypothetical protein